jgi:hypothetical protein
MNRIAASAVALSLLVACTQEKQTVETNQNQTPSDTTGTIVGVVTSLRTGLPLAGVTVAAPSAGGLRATTTDGNGAYSLGGLVGGATYEVRFSVAGHVSGLGVATIPDTAGDFPTNGAAQLNVELAQANATLSGHVYARDGLPAQGVVVLADLRAQGFDLVATATTDASGGYSLAGLPGAPTGLTISAVAQPWDADADGLADYKALTRTGVTYPAATSLLDFDLRLAAADLLLLTSNLESGTIAATDPIVLTFNRELDMTFTSVTLYDVTAGKAVAVTTTADATSKILTIVPVGGTALAANHSFTVTAYGVATNGDGLTDGRTFNTNVAVALLPPVTGLAVNPATVDYDNHTFSLSWPMSANASGYQIWVRDTSRNPSWLLAQTAPASFTPTANVTLPASFDLYGASLDGALQTPFANGVKVDFAVVAVNAAGDAAAPSTATPVQRADTVAPLVTAEQLGDANNTGSTPTAITLKVYFSEYMDPSILPAITLPVAGETATFAWNVNNTGGTYTITIPASTDGRGTYTITGAMDTSGNAMASKTGTLTSTIQLVTNGGFEDGSLTGWTTGFTGTASAPALSSTVTAGGTYSVHVGNATGIAEGGYSTIYQNVTLPAGAVAINLSISYQSRTNYGTYYYSDHNACYVQDSTGTTSYLTAFSTYSNAISYTTYTASLLSRAGQTVRIACETYQYGGAVTSMYLDNISVLATR